MMANYAKHPASRQRRRTCRTVSWYDINIIKAVINFDPGSQFAATTTKSNSVAPSEEYVGNFDDLLQHGANINIGNTMHHVAYCGKT